MKKSSKRWTVIDLFSGAGGMSYGFKEHPRFEIVAAVDAQIGKPSSGGGALDCNSTYEENIGIKPFYQDLQHLAPRQLEDLMADSGNPSNGSGSTAANVLISCAPCTGFSRTKNANHQIDDPKNQLVVRSELFVEYFRPDVFLMENARELIMGRFRHHYLSLCERLEALGYTVSGQIHFLDRFGLPQKRERALVVAVRNGFPLRTLEGLWDGYSISNEAVCVRRAIGELPEIAPGQPDAGDPTHVAPSHGERTLARLRAMPKDGGSWADLISHPEADHLLNPAMKRYAAEGNLGSHPDVYGRMWWDRPAVTIKRECAHVGNGRYSHPDQNRMLSVREMAALQGFPRSYRFVSSALSNMYRHIGDAVPPLISYQLAHLVEWILSGERPEIGSLVLRDTQLKLSDIRKVAEPEQAMVMCGD